MKILATVLMLAVNVVAADTAYKSPLELIKRDGELALFDGSSYFVFSQDGTFRSFPAGVSGRKLTGTWTSKEQNPVFFTATARVSWANGIQPRDDYRRIVFVVYDGSSEPRAPDSSPGLPAFRGLIKDVYRGYFLIDEFVKISKPQ
jgi:hypothetical protein